MNPTCTTCGVVVADGVPALLTETWRHEGCAATTALPYRERVAQLDPRSLDYLNSLSSVLACNRQLVEQWQRKLDTETRILRGGKDSLEERLSSQRVVIANAVTPEGKPLYGNDDKRRVALTEWQREDGLCESLTESIRESEERVLTLRRDLEVFANERADLLAESRLAAAWLTFAAGEGAKR